MRGGSIGALRPANRWPRQARLSVLGHSLQTMYPNPTGPELSPSVARHLDDVYFAADPLGYFTARISSLLAPGDLGQPGQEQADSAPSQFDKLVGEVSAIYRNPTKQARKLQVGIDAFAVRHHAAETLLRLTYVLVRRRNGSGSPSFWADVEATPTGMHDVLKGIEEAASENGDPWEQFRDLVSPDGADQDHPNVISSVMTFSKWFNFSTSLFTPFPLDVSAAHNKFKHGLGVRPRDDYLLTVASTGPDEQDNIPISALNGDGAVNLFDRTVLQFLARPGPRKAGLALESTTMRLFPEILLAQAALIAHTYAAMFSVAAHKHFNTRETSEDATSQSFTPAAYPGLLVNGPLPEHILTDKAHIAMRQPLTLHKDGTKPKDSALFYADGTWQTFKITGRSIKARVVDG